MNATISSVMMMMMMMMMMFLICIPSPLYALENPKQSPTSSSLKCATCDHGMEASSKCICKNPIKGSMHFPHPNLKDVNNSRKVLIQGLMEYFKSSNDHVESVAIRNTTTDVHLQNLKVEISIFPMGRENFTQRELDLVSFALGAELYKAPSMLGSYYFKQDMYIYLHGEGKVEGGSDSPDMDAIIMKVVSSVCGVLMMILTAAALYLLRKKMIAAREAREHHVEKAFNWIEMLEAMGDMI